MDFVRWQPNERVNIPDMEDATGNLLLLELLRQQLTSVLPATRPPQVFGGFDLTGYTIGVSTSATITRGRGLLCYWDNGVLRKGLMAGEEGPTTYVLDWSAAPADTYSVYVRAVLSNAVFSNRTFWNPTLGTPAEEIDSVATRRISTWEVTYLSSSVAPPGNGEWLKVADVDIDAGHQITAVTDRRSFFFEGRPDASYAQVWGSATDRNADRATYGVKDWYTFAQMVRAQLDAIIGSGGGHYRSPLISLSALIAEHYASGAHSVVNADSVTVAGGCQSRQFRSAPQASDVNNPQTLIDYIVSGVVPHTMIAADGEGGLGLPHVFYEPLMYAWMVDKAAVDAGIPGGRWGSYYSVGAAGTMALTAAAIEDPLLGNRVLRCNCAAGSAGRFMGWRTGGVDNGQALGGWWRISGQPTGWCVFRVPTQANFADASAQIGFANDITPLDSDPSRAYVHVDATTGTARGVVVSSDSTVTVGAVNLLPGGPVADTTYVFKITIIDANNVRFTNVATGASEIVTAVPASPLATSSGGNAVSYSMFGVSRTNTANLVTVDFYRWFATDHAMAGVLV